MKKISDATSNNLPNFLSIQFIMRLIGESEYIPTIHTFIGGIKMKLFFNYSVQIVLFIIIGAAYAELVAQYFPAYSLSSDLRDTLFLAIAAVSSFFSVQLIKSVFGLAVK